ncbi:MAG: hypothetical protein O3A46_04040 [Candidatus Poribacteria bacterium]|nr:hypothetical protein [Candidatus Poribacteria bacterium]
MTTYPNNRYDLLRKELHEFIERLPDYEVYASHRYVNFLIDFGSDSDDVIVESPPFLDEPLTDDDREAFAEAYEDFKAGRVVSQAEMERLVFGEGK